MRDDRPPAPRFRRWPSGFVGMLGLVLAVEIGLTRVERALEPISAADWAADRIASVSMPARSAEILCFGDSLIKCGVVPAAIEARLDRSTYNLALLAGTPPAAYFLLSRTLDAGAHPRAIVVDVKADTLATANYLGVVRDWTKLIGPREAFQLAREDLVPGFFTQYLVHSLLTSARIRLDLKAALSAWAAGSPIEPDVPWMPIIRRQYATNRGGIHHALAPWKHGYDPYLGGVLPADMASFCYPSRWQAYPTNLIYLDRFLALAASRRIPVFLLLPPIHPGVQRRREELGLEDGCQALVRNVRDKYRDVTVVDGRHAGFEYPVFADTYHLDVEGATALSHSLAEVVGRCLDGGGVPDRWERLPPFAPPGARLAVEVLAESRDVVARGDVPR